MEDKKVIKMTLKQGIVFALIIIGIICVSIAIIWINVNKKLPVNPNEKTNLLGNHKIDDWNYKGIQESGEGVFSNFYKGITGRSMTMDAAVAESSIDSGANIGFSTGGAKDVENFRENIKNGYFPISTDITYNGIFYDYVFDTGAKEESKELFSPSYSTAISKDPISNKNEYYMTVGLNSNIKQSDFARKKLNLTVVLDISGSMSSSFNSYYYDGEDKNKEESKSKMQIANEAVNILIDQLKDDDRFGMILFDDQAYLGKPLSLVGETDINAIKNHILEIQANGGTYFEAGYTRATELYNEYKNINNDEYENRIIVITDAMPNIGNTSKEGLLDFVKKNSENKIFTTFIGVGVDFNTELIEKISDVKGANYYSVHSSEDFKSRMGEQFEYMVTPLVFDLNLNLKSEDYEIETVYGSDTVNKENGNIMSVNTLFPSKTTDKGEVKGGVVLLKLKKKNENTKGNLKLSVSYKDRSGKDYSNSQDVLIEKQEEQYDNTGIRKAIVLTRYVNVVKNWILYERTESPRFMILPQIGIPDCDLTKQDIIVLLGENERRSTSLTVSEKYKEIFKQIKQYIIEENKILNDSTFNKEIEILDILI